MEAIKETSEVKEQGNGRNTVLIVIAATILTIYIAATISKPNSDYTTIKYMLGAGVSVGLIIGLIKLQIWIIKKAVVAALKEVNK